MNGEARSRSTGRSIGAVAAGFLVVVMFSIGADLAMHGTGIFPPMGQPMAAGLWILAIAYRFLFQMAGGYVTARLAPERPMRLVLILGAIGLVACIAGVAATWNQGPAFGPRWYPIALVVTALPSVWLGGKLHAMRS